MLRARASTSPLPGRLHDRADAAAARILGGRSDACDAVADEAAAQVARLDHVLAALMGRRRDRVRAIPRALARRDTARRLGGLLATAYVPWLVPLAQRARKVRRGFP